MDSLFPSGVVPTSNYTHVTPLGVALICVVLLVLFYMMFVKDKFVLVPPAAPDSEVAAGFGYGGSSGLALRSQLRSDGHAAGFQAGYEPPVFWGSSDSEELYSEQQVNARAEVARAIARGEGVNLRKSPLEQAEATDKSENAFAYDKSVYAYKHTPKTTKTTKAGFEGQSDAQLLAKSRGY